MRQIKFKGKRIDNGAWVEGFYSYLFNEKANDYKHDIVFQHMESADMSYPYPSCHTVVAEVDPDTVSQFTGLTDKNGKEIYEGDILETKGYKGIIYYVNHFASFAVHKINTNMIEFIDDNEVFTGEPRGILNTDIQIIGNIHDNPELLNEKQ